MTKDQQESRHFEARHIKELFGIDRNKLFYWSKTHGLLKPEVEEPEGTGNRAKFSIKNLVEIALIQEMLKYGFDLRTVQVIKTEFDIPRKQLAGLSIIDYSLSTEFLHQYYVYVLGIRQAKVSLRIHYYDKKRAVPATAVSSEFPGSNDFFLINEKADAEKASRFISIRIEMGQLAHEVLTRVGAG